MKLEKDEQIKHILDRFDFDSVHRHMQHVNWTWLNEK